MCLLMAVEKIVAILLPENHLQERRFEM